MDLMDEMWMNRALQLARLGMGFVSPNPMVGAVLVHPERGLVGEGWHQRFGGPHAEVNCLDSVLGMDSIALSQCTLYVTLEPCSHFGKTPPCADRIVASGIKRVVVGGKDPNPLVSGRGIQRLVDAGIEVKYGVLEIDARNLNRFFFTAHEKNRPWVTLKWAQTSDGFISPTEAKPVTISNESSRSLVHQMRAEHQAIWVGRETLRVDDPLLNVRSWAGPSPVRIVVDPDLTLPKNLRVFTDRDSPTLVLNSIREEEEGNLKWKLVETGDYSLPSLLDEIRKVGIHSLFVEGGTYMLNLILESGIWDEAIQFQSPTVFQEGKKAPTVLKGQLMDQFYLKKDRVSVFKPVSGR